MLNTWILGVFVNLPSNGVKTVRTFIGNLAGKLFGRHCRLRWKSLLTVSGRPVHVEGENSVKSRVGPSILSANLPFQID
jgi:hypothetical protein